MNPISNNYASNYLCIRIGTTNTYIIIFVLILFTVIKYDNDYEVILAEDHLTLKSKSPNQYLPSV